MINDLEEAQRYLNRDGLRYMDMLEPLRRGSVDVLHARPDGVTAPRGGLRRLGVTVCDTAMFWLF